MLEPSIWFSVHQWFTPTTLFIVLNLVIATIAITSKALRSGDDHPAGEPRKLTRAPSLVFDRIRSFNINLYRSHAPLVPSLDPIPPSPSPSPSSPLDPVADLASEGLDHEQHHFTRSQSDARPTAGEMPEKLAPKMKKSASVQSAFAHFEEKEIAPPQLPPPAEAAAAAAVDGGDGEEEGGEVDARADDFINRFRQQLKLQRLDSLLRYKEMLNRGR
ncbi:hypothetical protein IHE45_17G026100 [Dioscorea alata]|uniref:Uncharacterized protein n=1 Tax=Dioscorea alata TaxID=55571 RepID=A0ACB7UB11_DIOAL|nr:hypothetical protein IHE45_17G026100 [Dioscorea alata]